MAFSVYCLRRKIDEREHWIFSLSVTLQRNNTCNPSRVDNGESANVSARINDKISANANGLITISIGYHLVRREADCSSWRLFRFFCDVTSLKFPAVHITESPYTAAVRRLHTDISHLNGTCKPPVLSSPTWECHSYFLMRLYAITLHDRFTNRVIRSIYTSEVYCTEYTRNYCLHKEF